MPDGTSGRGHGSHDRHWFRHARSIDESGRSARNTGLLSLGRRDHSSHAGSMLIDEGLELLEETEALRLLAHGEIGRVGVTMGALPAIFPVNYRLIDGCVVFRSSPGSKMSAAASGAVVAFEVDDYNAADRSGWSVLVVGPSEVVHDLDATSRHWRRGWSPMSTGHAARSSGSSRRSCPVAASSICPPATSHRSAEKRRSSSTTDSATGQHEHLVP